MKNESSDSWTKRVCEQPVMVVKVLAGVSPGPFKALNYLYPHWTKVQENLSDNGANMCLWNKAPVVISDNDSWSCRFKVGVSNRELWEFLQIQIKRATSSCGSTTRWLYNCSSVVREVFDVLSQVKDFSQTQNSHGKMKGELDSVRVSPRFPPRATDFSERQGGQQFRCSLLPLFECS